MIEDRFLGFKNKYRFLKTLSNSCQDARSKSGQNVKSDTNIMHRVAGIGYCSATSIVMVSLATWKW